MGISLPALSIRPPEQQDLLGQAGKMMQLRSLMGEQQLQQQEIAKNQYAMGATKATNEAYRNAVTVGADGLPKFDVKGLTASLSNAGYGSQVPVILQHVQEFEKTHTELQEAQGKLKDQTADALGSVGMALKSAKYDPNFALTFLERAKADPNTPPQQMQGLQQMEEQIKQNPQLVKQIADNFIVQSPKQRQLAAEEEQAAARMKAAGKQPEGENPLGDKVAQLNQGLQTRYQVLNPGKPLPPQFQLQPDATQKDFDRIDKLMSQTETASGTKAQQDTTNAIRQQTLAMSQQTHADAQAAKSSKPVLAFDKDNKAHVLSMGDAQAAGYTGITEATPKQIDDAKTHTVVLNDMQTKLNDVVSSRAALDQGPVQRAIISKVLSHAEPGMINDWMKSSALSGATDQTKQYIQSVLSLKESALGLPKEITGGSRTSEIQGNALFQTLPSGSSVDSKYALDQAKKFQANIDRLHERVPEVRGLQSTAPHADLSGKSQGGGGLIYGLDPQGKLHSAPAGTKLPAGWTQEKAP
jgi:hypothetical protein